MDWKPYYATELRLPETRDKIVDWLRMADEDASLSAMIGNRTDGLRIIRLRLYSGHESTMPGSVSPDRVLESLRTAQ